MTDDVLSLLHPMRSAHTWPPSAAYCGLESALACTRLRSGAARNWWHMCGEVSGHEAWELQHFYPIFVTIVSLRSVADVSRRKLGKGSYSVHPAARAGN